MRATDRTPRRLAASSAGALAFALLAAPVPALAGDLVRGVRGKLSAGDLASGQAAVEAWRKKTGVDAEYLDAVGWLARGAQMLGRPDLAAAYVAELRREIPAEKPELLIPLGAAIEVEGKLRLARDGRGAAVAFLAGELTRARDTALRSRIRNSLNRLTLEGQPAPPLGLSDHVGPAPKGLAVVAATRLYGPGDDGKPATPAEEKVLVEKGWRESYPGLEAVPVVLDTGTMVTYGASATPTYVLVDRHGAVRLYASTRLAESELARRIEEVLAEDPATPSPKAVRP